MEKKVSATQARTQFGELMQSVIREQNPVIVEKSGKPQVVILSVEQYERLQGKVSSWVEQLERTHALIMSENLNELPDPADIIRKMREERDATLLVP